MFHSSFLRRLAFAVSCVLLLTISLPLMLSPQAASAATGPMTVTISPTQGPPGSPLTATGYNFGANDTIHVLWGGVTGPDVYHNQADSSGNFRFTFPVPNVGQGVYQLWFWDEQQRTGQVPQAPFAVSVLIVKKVFTADSNNNAKTAFAPRDPIHYMWEAQNMSSTPVTATVTYHVSGPQPIYDWSGTASLASGPLRYYSAPTIPTTAPAGTYTITVTVTYNGVSSSGQSQFTVSDKVANAIAWAKSQINNPEQNWSGLCEKFVEYAYGIYGGTADGGYRTAQDAFKNLHTSTNWSPDIGALVWFTPEPENQNDGHVGIYIGNGQFISAIEGKPVVQIHSLKDWSTHAPYEGWGDAPTNWPGR